MSKETLKNVGKAAVDMAKEEGKDILKDGIASGVRNAILVLVAVIAIGVGGYWAVGKVTTAVMDGSKAVYAEAKQDVNNTFQAAKTKTVDIAEATKAKASEITKKLSEDEKLSEMKSDATEIAASAKDKLADKLSSWKEKLKKSEEN